MRKLDKSARLKVIGVFIIIGGLALIGLSVAADLVGLGGEPGFGRRQMMAAILGLVMASSGSVLAMGALEHALTHPRSVAKLVSFVVPGFLYLIMIVQVFPFEIDDSYISMRYASNLVGCRRDDARNSRLAVPSSSERLEAKKPSG